MRTHFGTPYVRTGVGKLCIGGPRDGQDHTGEIRFPPLTGRYVSAEVALGERRAMIWVWSDLDEGDALEKILEDYAKPHDL